VFIILNMYLVYIQLISSIQHNDEVFQSSVDVEIKYG